MGLSLVASSLVGGNENWENDPISRRFFFQVAGELKNPPTNSMIWFRWFVFRILTQLQLTHPFLAGRRVEKNMNVNLLRKVQMSRQCLVSQELPAHLRPAIGHFRDCQVWSSRQQGNLPTRRCFRNPWSWKNEQFLIGKFLRKKTTS